MLRKHWDRVALALILLGVAGSIIFAKDTRPVWTGRECDNAACVTDVLNMLYPDRAVDAKVTTVVVGHTDCEGCGHVTFWVWYRQ